MELKLSSASIAMKSSNDRNTSAFKSALLLVKLNKSTLAYPEN
jgi:hypothetical protein